MSAAPVAAGDILGLSLPALQAQMAVWRVPGYRARQVWNWIYRQHAASFDEMTVLPGSLREMLTRFYRIDPLVPVECGMDTADAVPGAELLVIEGMGHDLPLAVAPRVIEAIARHAV